MAVISKFEGILIGKEEYTKEGKTTYTYYVLITQKKDEKTGLYGACELAVIKERENPLKEPKHGQKVVFDGEFIKTKTGGFFSYSGIEVVKP